MERPKLVKSSPWVGPRPSRRHARIKALFVAVLCATQAGCYGLLSAATTAGTLGMHVAEADRQNRERREQRCREAMQHLEAAARLDNLKRFEEYEEPANQSCSKDAKGWVTALKQAMLARLKCADALERFTSKYFEEDFHDRASAVKATCEATGRNVAEEIRAMEQEQRQICSRAVRGAINEARAESGPKQSSLTAVEESCGPLAAEGLVTGPLKEIAAELANARRIKEEQDRATAAAAAAEVAAAEAAEARCVQRAKRLVSEKRFKESVNLLVADCPGRIQDIAPDVRGKVPVTSERLAEALFPETREDVAQLALNPLGVRGKVFMAPMGIVQKLGPDAYLVNLGGGGGKYVFLMERAKMSNFPFTFFTGQIVYFRSYVTGTFTYQSNVGERIVPRMTAVWATLPR